MSESESLLRGRQEGNIIQRAAAGEHGLQRLNTIVLALETGKKFSLTTSQYNYTAVILGGVADIRTSNGDFLEVGRRTDVFAGMPYAVTMSPQTDFEIESLSDDFQFAGCWATALRPMKTALIQPSAVEVHLHTVGRISYQVNRIVHDELSLWETYIPSTNWAYFPPMVYRNSEALLLLKQDRATGFAMHRLLRDEVDDTFTSQHNDLVVVPEGSYHSLVSSPIGVTYALGMSHTTESTATPHPSFAWYSRVYAHGTPDGRLPIVDIGMEPIEASEE